MVALQRLPLCGASAFALSLGELQEVMLCDKSLELVKASLDALGHGRTGVALMRR